MVTSITSDVRLTASRVFDLEISQDLAISAPKDKTPKPAKNLIEFYGLVKNIIDHYEARASSPIPYKVLFTEEEPDAEAKGEIITFSLVKREPGAFSQGAPFEGKVRNMKPIFREELEDTENPGYRLAIHGYWHDNIVRFTCWAQTNKGANARAQWLENMLDEYMWFLRAEGVSRFLFWERSSDMVVEIKGNKWYGRPLDYFVRTETLKVFSEKKIEEILLSVAVKQGL